MFNSGTRKRQNYKQLNNGTTGRSEDMRRQSIGGLSHADTLVPKSPEDTSAHTSNCSSKDSYNGHGSVPDCATYYNQDTPVMTSSDAILPPANKVKHQIQPNAKTSQFEVRQHVRGLADEGSPVDIHHTVSIPSSSSEGTVAIVSQKLSGRSLQRLGASTIRQIINFPAENLRYGDKPHDESLHPEQLYSHDYSDSTQDSDEKNDQYLSDRNGKYEPLRAEESFRKKYRFPFDEFSMNPFEKPSIGTNADRNLLGERYSEKFDVWLKNSPYGIWVTKYAAEEPYAICKYSNCGHLFFYEGNPTPYNIIAHLRRNHKYDFELFQAKLGKLQPKLSELENVLSSNRKPFPLRSELIHFMTANELKINQLNLFIETIIPFSTVEAPAFKKLLECSGARNRDYICSRKGLVNMMKKYEEAFDSQMKEALAKSFNYNILLDMWTSSNQRSYLAVIVSFCPNLCKGRDKLTAQDVITNGTPNAHVIDFVDLSDERHTGEKLREALLTILGKYSIAHKIGSITVDNGSNNISMLSELDNDIRGGPGVNKEGGLVKIRCMNHVLNRVLFDVMAAFEKSQKALLSRIDRLTIIMKNNIFIRNKLSEYTSRTIPTYNCTRFLSRYRQLSVFLKLTGTIKNFYFENRLDSKYQLTPDDLYLFCYESTEMETLKFFLRVTSIFHEYTMLLQDDMLNTLPNGVEYYVQIDDFFKSCKQIRDGSTDERHLRYAGLKRRHLNFVEENIRCNVFSTIEDAYPKFQKYLSFALAEPGYWVAHFLQPFCKTGILLANFDHGFQQNILEVTKRYVNDYLGHFQNQASHNRSQRIQKSSNDRKFEPQRRGYKVLKNLRRRQNRDVCFEAINPKNEWELYLEEPIQHDVGFLDYWLANQDKYPTLFHLALSFYHTRLSTADVERCFSVSRRVLENRFSLSSVNLKRTMILRNRLKCFGIGYNLQEVRDISLEQWIEDEENEACSTFVADADADADDITYPFSSSSDSDLSEYDE